MCRATKPKHAEILTKCQFVFEYSSSFAAQLLLTSKSPNTYQQLLSKAAESLEIMVKQPNYQASYKKQLPHLMLVAFAY